MQMFIQFSTMYQIRLRSILGKSFNLVGTRRCTNSSSLTEVKSCDFCQVLHHRELPN